MAWPFWDAALGLRNNTKKNMLMINATARNFEVFCLLLIIYMIPTIHHCNTNVCWRWGQSDMEIVGQPVSLAARNFQSWQKLFEKSQALLSRIKIIWQNSRSFVVN